MKDIWAAAGKAGYEAYLRKAEIEVRFRIPWTSLSKRIQDAWKEASQEIAASLEANRHGGT
jgi:precorrin-2 methylase